MTADGRADRNRAAVTAARRYYLEGHTMEAIARELRTSRSTVSRLLGHARETGVVEIRVQPPLDEVMRLETELAGRYGVAAHVVPAHDCLSDVDRLDRVARAAGRMLSGFVDSGSVVGVAWGSTVNAVSRQLVSKRVAHSVVVQLNGAGNVRSTGVEYASAILDRFGEAFGAHVEQFPIPAVFDEQETRAAMWRERSTRRVLAVQASADVVLFGLGAPFAEVPSQVHLGGYLDTQDYESLARDGAVGDVATVFYRLDGSSEDVVLNRRTTGPPIARLRRVPRRVCVVSGLRKLRSVRGALAAHLPTDLVLDDALARALLDS